MQTSEEFRRQLEGYGMLLAEIFYFLPDKPTIIGPSFTWQTHDLAPKFPRLRGFLEFWQNELEAPIHSVIIAHKHLIGPTEWKGVDGVITIN